MRRRSITIILLIKLFFLTVCTVATNDKINDEKPDCLNITNCEECLKENCTFGVKSCKGESENKTICTSPEDLIDTNCTIVSKVENCSSLLVSTPSSVATDGSSTTVPTSSETVPTTTVITTTNSDKTVSTELSTKTIPTEKPAPETVKPISSSTVNPSTNSPSPSASASANTSPNSITDKPEGKHSGFDTGSFIGGIVLTLGLMAIAFVGYKFYRARTEHNYHTLHETVHM